MQTKKQRRKQRIKATVAIILALLFIAAGVSPLFSQSKTEEGLTLEEFQKINLLLNAAETEFFEPVDREKIINAMYRSMMEALDPYSTYFTPQELTRYIDSMRGELEGIGATISLQQGIPVIDMPLKGSPAERAGIYSGDQIIKVDDIDVEHFPLHDVGSMIRGEAGTTVHLQLRREGMLLEFTIVREKITGYDVEYKMLPEGIAHIRCSRFDDHTEQYLRVALKRAVYNRPKGIVLDLRGNPGGYLTQAIAVADMMLPKDTVIVTMQERTKKTPEIYRSTHEPITTNVVVLIDKNSASASEIVAGSLQQYGVMVIGETSYGKGRVQSIRRLTDGSAYKLTISEYRLANDVVVDGIGVQPDILVDADVALERAIEELLK